MVILVTVVTLLTVHFEFRNQKNVQHLALVTIHTSLPLHRGIPVAQLVAPARSRGRIRWRALGGRALGWGGEPSCEACAPSPSGAKEIDPPTWISMSGQAVRMRSTISLNIEMRFDPWPSASRQWRCSTEAPA